MGCRKPGTPSPSQAQPLLLSDRAPQSEGGGSTSELGAPQCLHPPSAPCRPPGQLPWAQVRDTPRPAVTACNPRCHTLRGGPTFPETLPVSCPEGGHRGTRATSGGQRCHCLPLTSVHGAPRVGPSAPWRLGIAPTCSEDHTSALSPLRVLQGPGSPQHLPKSLSGPTDGTKQGEVAGPAEWRTPRPPHVCPSVRGASRMRLHESEDTLRLH